MAVDKVQNSNLSPYKRLSIGGAVVTGILAGNAVRDIAPLPKGSISKDKMQSITRNSYTDSYDKMSNFLKSRGNLSQSEDAFVKMVESGDIKGNYTQTERSLQNLSKEAHDDFQTINWLVSQDAQRSVQSQMNKEIKTAKRLRPVLPFAIAGGVAFAIGSIWYNFSNYSNYVKHSEAQIK